MRHVLGEMSPEEIGPFDRSLLRPVRLVDEGEPGVEM